MNIVGSLRKTRRQRQRQRGRRQTKGLMSKTMAVHVRYDSLYISLPSSANNVKRPSSALSGELEPQRLIFRICISELNAFAAYLAGASFNADIHSG